MDITIATLIYKSPKYLDFVMNSLIDNASEVHDVKYLIVCNDATDEVKQAADEWSGYPNVRSVVHENGNKDDFWIQNVYNAWNRCLSECDTTHICFVNSDMAFTKGWIDALASHNLSHYIPTSRLIESARMPSLPGLISKNFGQTLATFDKNAFESYANDVREPGYTIGVGAYMPSLFVADNLRMVGGWSKNYGNIPGDKITFSKLYKYLGLRHIMVKDSIVYHLQRGESVESGDA